MLLLLLINQRISLVKMINSFEKKCFGLGKKITREEIVVRAC